MTLGINLLKKGIGLYVYYNKPTENSRNFKIHFSNCGNCAWGTGKISNAEPGKNVVWIGAFNNKEQAKEFLNNNFSTIINEIEECNCCK